MGKTKKKILIYSPYWHILGGGERYLLEIANSTQKNFKVYLLADKIIEKKAKENFGIILKNVDFLDTKIFRRKSFYGRFLFLRQFDICFYMTDGSLFFPGAKKNYLIIQSPSHIPKISVSTKFKISGWKIICYSSFMENIIRERISKKSIVLPPAVDINKFRNSSKQKKEKIFLSVGRFFTSNLHEKKHDFLIDFFQKNYLSYFRGWRLYLCGNLTEESGRNTLAGIKNKIRNFPVEIFINIPFSKLTQFYKLSSIYWHAAGFRSDPVSQPEKMEHFGITTIEAMAAGTVPVVFGAGGQTDIVENGKNGLLWQNEKEFLKANLLLIKNKKELNKISNNASKNVEKYSFYNFKKRIYELV